MLLTPLRLLTLAFPLLVLVGCSSTPSCGGNMDYLEAAERPPLQLPPEITPTERIQPMVIPPVDPNPTTLDPVPGCLDEPPRFFARKGSVSDPAAEAVRAWAAAWAARNADAVIGAYSASYQSATEGESADFLAQRRQQVASGRQPEPNLEDVKVATAGADRRVVTFIQRFGDGAVRKELTLVREGNAWRIVAERTLEVL